MPDFSAPSAPLKFDQGSKVILPFLYQTALLVPIPITGYGARLAFKDTPTSSVLLLLSTSNGKIVNGGSNGVMTGTISATDTTPGTSISGHGSGTWDLYFDPNGSEDAASFKFLGGTWQMVPQGTP